MVIATRHIIGSQGLLQLHLQLEDGHITQIQHFKYKNLETFPIIPGKTAMTNLTKITRLLSSDLGLDTLSQVRLSTQ